MSSIVTLPTASGGLERYSVHPPRDWINKGQPFKRVAYAAAHAHKVDGIKVSLLDSAKEIAMRRRLPDRAGLLRDPQLATQRMGRVLALYGIH